MRLSFGERFKSGFRHDYFGASIQGWVLKYTYANFRPHMSQVNSNEPSLSGFENAMAARFCSALSCLAVRLLVVLLLVPLALPLPLAPACSWWCSFFGTTFAFVGTWYSDAKAALLPSPGKKFETAIRTKIIWNLTKQSRTRSRHWVHSAFKCTYMVVYGGSSSISLHWNALRRHTGNMWKKCKR